MSAARSELLRKLGRTERSSSAIYIVTEFLDEEYSVMSMKIALVVGACSGAGHYSALALAKLGTHIIGTYDRYTDNADEVAREIEACGARAAMLRLDTNQLNVTTFARQLKTILSDNFGSDKLDNILINTGTTPDLSASQEKNDAWRFYVMHVRIPHLITEALNDILADSGNVVLLSSCPKRAS